MFISLRLNLRRLPYWQEVRQHHTAYRESANFIPKLYDASVVDEVIGVPDDEAIRAGRELAATEGLLAGISSGAAVYAARQLAQRPEFRNKKIVALLPDTGERYLSTELFAFDAYPLD